MNDASVNSSRLLLDALSSWRFCGGDRLPAEPLAQRQYLRLASTAESF